MVGTRVRVVGWMEENEHLVATMERRHNLQFLLFRCLSGSSFFLSCVSHSFV